MISFDAFFEFQVIKGVEASTERRLYRWARRETPALFGTTVRSIAGYFDDHVFGLACIPTDPFDLHFASGTLSLGQRPKDDALDLHIPARRDLLLGPAERGSRPERSQMRTVANDVMIVAGFYRFKS